MVKWVLNDADIRNRQFNAQGQELMKSLFLQILSFIPNKRKRHKKQKTNQRSLDQGTEAVSDERLEPSANCTSLRKLLVKESFQWISYPQTPKNCKRRRYKQKSKEKAKVIQGLTKLNWNYYWAYTVKPHSEWMTFKDIINYDGNMVPTLANSICLAQLKAGDSQLTLLKANTKCLQH